MLDALRGVWNRRKAWLCALIALEVLSCASLEESASRDIKVTESPIVAYPIAWMDNERVLLRYSYGDSVTYSDGARKAVFHWVSYNYKTGEQQDYGRVGTSPCYRDGYVSHYMTDDKDQNQLIAVYGELGKETRRKVKKGEIWFENSARGSCTPWSEVPKRPPWINERNAIWFLWPRFGFIDCRTKFVSPLARNINARFYRFNDSVGVELPLSCHQVSGYGALRYHPFKNAYFAFEFDVDSPWPTGRDRHAFWLYPDGRVDTLTFPYSQAIRYTATPVADGILAFSEPANRKDDYWVYFVTPQTSRRLFRGSATGVTSPDGCKVAMLIDRDFKAKVWSRDVKTPVELKILDFCISR